MNSQIAGANIFNTIFPQTSNFWLQTILHTVPIQESKIKQNKKKKLHRKKQNRFYTYKCWEL